MFLANIYVSHVDTLVMENHASQIAFYARLVDDSVVCASDIDSIQRTQNSWRPKLVGEVASRGGRRHEAEQPVAFFGRPAFSLQWDDAVGSIQKAIEQLPLRSPGKLSSKSIAASIIRG